MMNYAIMIERDPNHDNTHKKSKNLILCLKLDVWLQDIN